MSVVDSGTPASYGGPTGSYGGPTGSYVGQTGMHVGQTRSYGGPTGNYGGQTDSYGGQTGSYGGPTGSYVGETGSHVGQTGIYGGPTGNYGGQTGNFGGQTASYGGPTGSYGGNISSIYSPATVNVHSGYGMGSIIHVESIEVAVPSRQLLQRAKAVLGTERDFPPTSHQVFTAKFMEGLDAKKMTDAVATFGESLSRKLEIKNISQRITALLRPFRRIALESGQAYGKNLAVAFSLNGDEVTELNNAVDDAKAAQREGRDVVQNEIDQSQDHDSDRLTPPMFYQILITAAYSCSDKVFNFGYCYIHRKDSSLPLQLLRDPYTKAKTVAAMKIECSAALAQVLRAMSFSRRAVTLVPNDGNFKSQAALL